LVDSPFCLADFIPPFAAIFFSSEALVPLSFLPTDMALQLALVSGVVVLLEVGESLAVGVKKKFARNGRDAPRVDRGLPAA
jgi:hypothetical protein